MSIFTRLFHHGITVYALVGASGTGKSFRAKLIARQNGIPAIIDDGLLIQNDKIIAGRTAKHEKTYMGAVRIALFDDKEYRDEVAKALKANKIKKILIIGTSEKMVKKIADRLQLPPPGKIIKITDIATEEEIKAANQSRMIEGKHVIPVPAIEVKRSYPQIFAQGIREILSKNRRQDKAKRADGKTAVFSEKSVVEPEFSKKGRLEISEAALTQMVLHCVDEHMPSVRVKKLTIKTNSRGYRLIITVDVPFNTQLTGTIHRLQDDITNDIERETGILINEVSIIIDQMIGVEKAVQEQNSHGQQKDKKVRRK